ncbi:hypothetical protein [Cohnella rhizosphaerae]|uniref:hypothetical protein n=1 Tax=Cohnella rhizosphaerae TaxID=1457232 RepID=UPI0024062BEE|nr:hypothetical protein [Cohnella rhizosphaerae]
MKNAKAAAALLISQLIFVLLIVPWVVIALTSFIALDSPDSVIDTWPFAVVVFLLGLSGRAAGQHGRQLGALPQAQVQRRALVGVHPCNMAAGCHLRRFFSGRILNADEGKGVPLSDLLTTCSPPSSRSERTGFFNVPRGCSHVNRGGSSDTCPRGDSRFRPETLVNKREKHKDAPLFPRNAHKFGIIPAGL